MIAKLRIYFFVLPVLFFIFLSGCSTVIPYTKPPIDTAALNLPGIYHTVARGETLWRISRRYGVDLDQLTRINKISDNSSIEVGQRIFVPDQLRDKSLELKYKEGDDFIWPVKGRIVCSFGGTFNNMINKGIKIAPYGNNEIVASRTGKVVFLSEGFAGLGRTVILDHGDGYFTVYGLNSDTYVKPGDIIKRGAPIGRVTGSGKSGCLHFEIRKGHIPQNPTFFLS